MNLVVKKRKKSIILNTKITARIEVLMMNKLFKGIVFLFWIAILVVFFKYQLYIDGAEKLLDFCKHILSIVHCYF